MGIIGYIILGLSILITLGWCFDIRHKAKYEQAKELPKELQGFLMTVSIILVFAIPLSPFHLLWMLPVSFVIGLLSLTTPLSILFMFSSIYFSVWYIGIRNPGRKFYVDGDYENAVRAFKEEVSKKPSSEAYFNLALAYGALKQHDNEIAAYQSALKLSPNRPEIHFNIGNAYIDIGDKQKAIDAFKQAINLRPNYFKAHYTVCKTYAEIGDIESAHKELEIIRSIDSRSADELSAVIDAI